jgi:DNA-binding LacI/PurR family transcriptional regulator
MSPFLRPPLTTLHQPIDEIAARVVEMLVANIAGQPIADRHILFQPTLMIRPSSDPAGRGEAPRPEESGPFLSFAK